MCSLPWEKGQNLSWNFHSVFKIPNPINRWYDCSCSFVYLSRQRRLGRQIHVIVVKYTKQRRIMRIRKGDMAIYDKGSILR